VKLENRVALVTGGSRGLGKAIARKFLEEGASVIIAAVNEARIESAVKELSALGPVRGVKMDVSRFDEVGQTIAGLVQEYGAIDILVNNAGIPSGEKGSGATLLKQGGATTSGAMIYEMTEERFDLVIGTNLKSVFACTKAAAPSMIERGWGRIINMSSVTAHNGSFGQANYAAAKAGIIALTKSWARELGPGGITVNAVAPGYTMTDMVSGAPEELKELIIGRTPVGRLGRPEDVAEACVYLASDGASFVNGAVIRVDGGIVV